MRFDPDGARVAYTLGYGEPAATRRLRVVVATADATADGAPLVELPAGHEPRWWDAANVYARHAEDGAPATADTAGGVTLHRLGANDGDLTAANETIAYAATRTSGVRAVASQAERVVSWPGTYEPSLSRGGTIVLRDSVSGILRLERVPGAVDVAAHTPILGPGTRARWSAQTVVWDTLPYGRVFGRSTPDGPTRELTMPGRACSRPVPLWTGVRLYVGLVLDAGVLVLAEWGSLLQGEARGWPIGASSASAFDWDLALDGDVVRVAYLTPGGLLAIAHVDPRQAPISLAAPAPPPPPPPPVPPPPTPPRPPTPPPEPRPEDPAMSAYLNPATPPSNVIAAVRRRIAARCLREPRLAHNVKPFGGPFELVDGAQGPDVRTVNPAEPPDLWVSPGLLNFLETWGLEPLLRAPDTGAWEAKEKAAVDQCWAHLVADVLHERPAAGPLAGPLAVEGRDITAPG